MQSVSEPSLTRALCFFFLQVYERGVAMFKWPNVFDIWNTYLTKFIQRYVSCFKTSSLQLDKISKFLDISAQVMLKV